MSAAEVLTKHRGWTYSVPDYEANKYADQQGPCIAIPACTCGWIAPGDETHGDHMLDVLSTNGFEVVELPKSFPDENTDYYPAAAGWVIETPDHMPGAIAFDAPGDVLNPDEARAVAAAFLAAARIADGFLMDFQLFDEQGDCET